MHTIEPHYRWRVEYIASEDNKSPFYNRVYSEFGFTNTIYNYFIHPQWDGFESETLYLKILYVDYADSYAILELIGEWNDCIYNDVLNLKQHVIDYLQKEGISKFILIGENVLNFHGSDDCYYEEWFEDVDDEGGWVCFVNFLDHVLEEMEEHNINQYVHFGEDFLDVKWRTQKPRFVFQDIASRLERHL
ncbi:MAG: hypothetical protein GY810_25975 [Aureispira sp.]|nr:hypothetical protein [Aureispira sp.]